MPFKIYPPQLGEIDPKYQMDVRFLHKNLEKIFSPGPVSAIYNTKTLELLPVTVDAVSVKTGFQFKIEEIPAGGIQSFLREPCVLVAGVEAGKLQFAITNLRSTGSNSLSCDMPKMRCLFSVAKTLEFPHHLIAPLRRLSSFRLAKR